MPRVRTFATIGLCGSVAALTAVAQEPAASDQGGSRAEAFIKQLDTSGDGVVSLDEAFAPQKEQFKEIDADGSGTLDAGEASKAFKAKVPRDMLEEKKKGGMPDPGETFITNLDKNGDGSVDAAEFQQPTAESFGRTDADGDAKVTTEEVIAYFKGG